MINTNMGHTCPTCGIGIMTANAGGYRTFCDACVVSGDGYDLFVDDCLSVMGRMPDNYIDMTCTSPPYDNLRAYGKGFDADSFDWKPIIKELYRVTAVGGVVVWVVADATINGSETGTSFRQALWAMECGFRLHDTMIYEKSGFPFPESTRYNPVFEYMFVFSKGKPKSFNPIEDRKNAYSHQKVARRNSDRQRDGSIQPNSAWKKDRNKKIKQYGRRNNIWYMSVGKGNSGDDLSFKHPASFPESLANDHIISWSSPGDLVFDPFLGSGTTAKMAIRNGRKFIGCDIEASYVDIARQRIENEVTAVLNRGDDFTTTEAEKSKGQLAIWDLT